MSPKNMCESCECGKRDSIDAECNCWCHENTTTTYRPEQIVAALPGWRAVYRVMEADGLGYFAESVAIWACVTTIEQTLSHGRSLKPRPRAGRSVMGMAYSSGEGMVFVEDSSNFVGYASPDMTDHDIRTRLLKDETNQSVEQT